MIINIVLIGLLLIGVCTRYVNQERLSALTGNHFDERAYIMQNALQLSVQLGIALILVLGVFMEWRRSRLAWLINIMLPLLGLIMFIVQLIQHKNSEQLGEAQQLLILVALPLMIVLVLYSVIYYYQYRNTGRPT